MKSLFEQNGGTYWAVGNYVLPDLTLPPQKQSFLGLYGRLRKTYVKEYKKGMYSSLLITGKLFDHLHEIDEQAQDMLKLLMKQTAENQGITEQLKATDQMVWVRDMNNIRHRSNEIVFREVIYCV